jgi:hypothetical protein
MLALRLDLRRRVVLGGGHQVDREIGVVFLCGWIVAVGVGHGKLVRWHAGPDEPALRLCGMVPFRVTPS